MVEWSKALPLTAHCLSPLLGPVKIVERSKALPLTAGCLSPLLGPALMALLIVPVLSVALERRRQKDDSFSQGMPRWLSGLRLCL